MKKKVIITIVVLVLVVLAVGYYKYTHWIVYTNSDGEYQITFPYSWRKVDLNDPGDSLYVNMPTTGQGWVGNWTSAQMFIIDSMPIEDWVGDAQELGRSDDRVFYAVTAQDYPDDLQHLLPQRSQILSTFKFIK